MIRWHPMQMDVIATLLREGKSARAIAKVFEVNVGAIVGIVSRTPRLREIGFARPQPQQFRKHTNEREHIAERLQHRDNGDIIIGRATVRKERTLMELTSAQCRFPILEDAQDGHLFCAETREDDSSYCAIHRKLCRAQARTTIQPREKEPQS